MVTRGFVGRRPKADDARRLPPGQSLTTDFPVLSLGPTPAVRLERWKLAITHDRKVLASWSWEEFQALPHTPITADIHCVTKWSRFDTQWEGVTIDALLLAGGVTPPTQFVLAKCYDGYTTNIPLADQRGAQAMIATRYAGEPLAAEHGGPARLLVPHLYLWKSAKWIAEFRFVEWNAPGFWEERGYHIRGDPWQEQRYTNDP
ncbi:MAG: sulfite oxidase-like oxidoreductase [Gemmatimonadetes bacterium]|nr:sulfite oxidase-like oxidoreductase [Gemmatimonadota bacterium]